MPARTLLIFCLLFALTAIRAQTAAAYVDVVEVKGGDKLVGTLVEYRYGEVVRLVDLDGEVREVAWNKLRRLHFRLAEGMVREVGGAAGVAEPEFVTPSRAWRHQIGGRLGFGRIASTQQFNFGNNVNIFSIGAEYHYVRPVGWLTAGLGLGFDLMNNRRDESLLSTTVFLEKQLGKRRIRPFARFTFGAGLPVGSDRFPIDRRTVGFLTHPSVGLAFHPQSGRWGTLLFDLGYRFLSADISLTTPNFEMIDRRLAYRRLTLRSSVRF